MNGGDDGTRTRDLCRDSNRLISNGVGGHLLIPPGTGCHFLSSPYCTQIESTYFFAPKTLKFCEFCTTLHLTRRSIVLDCDSVLPLRRYRAPISSRVCPPVQSYRAPSSEEAGHARCGTGHPDALNAARKQIRAPDRGPERAVQHSRQ